jgi:hypothetical protein
MRFVVELLQLLLSEKKRVVSKGVVAERVQADGWSWGRTESGTGRQTSQYVVMYIDRPCSDGVGKFS